MKRFIFIGICIVLLFVLFSGVVWAETMYVSDAIKIMLRTGPGVDHKIIAMIRSGEEVEVIEPDEKWTRVRLPSGKEGWILSRFLTSKQPSRILLERLKENHKALSLQAASLLEENTKLKKENKKFGLKLAENEETLAKISKSYETLKTESAEFLELKSNYEKTASQHANQTEKLKKTEEELTKLLLYQNIKWFLSGAGVLIAGFILGFSAKRQRRKSSLL